MGELWNTTSAQDKERGSFFKMSFQTLTAVNKLATELRKEKERKYHFDTA